MLTGDGSWSEELCICPPVTFVLALAAVVVVVVVVVAIVAFLAVFL